MAIRIGSNGDDTLNGGTGRDLIIGRGGNRAGYFVLNDLKVGYIVHRSTSVPVCGLHKSA